MSLKLIVNNKDTYTALMQYLEDRIKVVQRSLEVATEVADVHRLQGNISCLRRLLTLREEVNSKDK